MYNLDEELNRILFSVKVGAAPLLVLRQNSIFLLCCIRPFTVKKLNLRPNL